MTTEIKIEKGIPISDRSWGKWASLAKKMDIGDSVIVNGRIEAMALRSALVHLGFRAVTRGVDTSRARVWKIAK